MIATATELAMRAFIAAMLLAGAAAAMIWMWAPGARA